jgi:UDP-N-acetylmuramoyl-L-alanyl-D-glutamate--2,6-diaminopimelate ligase
MAQRLTDLLGPDVAVEPGADVLTAAPITAITADSRTVAPGALFVAIAGTKADGAAYIADAIAKGAAAILIGEDVALDPASAAAAAIPVLRAPEPRLALARIAARFYGPGPDTIVAVTGTSGKTSVAEFTRQIFAHAGHKAASLGTLGVVTPESAGYGSLTTPDPVTLARTLAKLRASGITHLAMEASSHGLDQYRLDGVRLAAGAFTNLGRDHMDYHPTVAHYFNAKMRLFRELLPLTAAAVVNADGAEGQAAIDIARARGLCLLTVGAAGDTVRLTGVTRDGFRQRLSLKIGGRTQDILLPLVGAYQVENAMTAAGLAIAAGLGPNQVVSALAHLKGVPGRLEIIGTARGGLGVVDYAHKPEALMAALTALRPFATGKLICVFGCGGDRDRGKRPIMGEISARLADVTIVTDDNPRTEVAASIRAEVMAGAPGLLRETSDRGEAIRSAVAMMGAGDVVVVAGKGHETGQIVGDKVLPFSDHEVLAAAMAEHDGA